MRNFKFNLGVPGTGETEIASINLYESADGLTDWTQTDTILVENLIDESGKKLWVSNIANPSKYARLVPASASGVERLTGNTLPPALTDTGTFTVFCWVIDLGLEPIAGIDMIVKPANKAKFAKTTNKLAVRNFTKYSDNSGYISMVIPADIGQVTISIAGNEGIIDTTGKSGAVINFISLV